MKQYELFSYAYDFVSQLMDNPFLFSHIKKIILFGSVARGDFTPQSDLDLFVDIGKGKNKVLKKELEGEINKFEVRCEKTWHLRDIALPIKVIVGTLEDQRWLELRNEIISYGKILYSRYEELPQKLQHHILVNYDLHNLKQKNKMAFLRSVYGYTSKKKGNEYIHHGIFTEVRAKKIGLNAILIEAESFLILKKTLQKFKVPYKVIDAWIKML